MADWARAIQRDKPDIVDIAGGEPLLIPWLRELIESCPKTAFGLSTNGLYQRGVMNLLPRLRNIVSINMSIHPDCGVRDYPRYLSRQVERLLKNGYTVHCNVVDYGDTVSLAQPVIREVERVGGRVVISPYERTDDLGTKLDQPLVCKAGINHIVVGPDGTTWPCLTLLRSPYADEHIIGNWLDAPIDPSKVEQPCYMNCTDFYILPEQHASGDCWNLQVRKA